MLRYSATTGWSGMNSSSFWFRAVLLHGLSAVARQRVRFPSALALARDRRVVCCSDGSTCGGVQILASSLAFNRPLLRQNYLHQTSSPISSLSQRTKTTVPRAPLHFRKGGAAAAVILNYKSITPSAQLFPLPSSLLRPPSYST